MPLNENVQITNLFTLHVVAAYIKIKYAHPQTVSHHFDSFYLFLMYSTTRLHLHISNHFRLHVLKDH